MRKKVEHKIKDLEYCLGRGAYEDALCHTGDLFRYCFERFKLMSGNCMDMDKAIETYLKRTGAHDIEGPTALEEFARRLD